MSVAMNLKIILSVWLYHDTFHRVEWNKQTKKSLWKSCNVSLPLLQLASMKTLLYVSHFWIMLKGTEKALHGKSKSHDPLSDQEAKISPCFHTSRHDAHISAYQSELEVFEVFHFCWVALLLVRESPLWLRNKTLQNTDTNTSHYEYYHRLKYTK